MAAFRWKGSDMWQNCKKWLHERKFMLKLTYHSIFYNEFMTWGTCLETLIEPLIWFIDHFVRYMGPSFVTLIVGMVLSVTVVFYACLLPDKLAESVPWTVLHLVTGHYFLYCTIFYYFRAAFTDPGHPPQNQDLPETVSICKRCIAPKPPRAHHCRVCNKCVLKMDHHCPWLNNCIGHNNHRYFLLFCTYMWIGTTYASYAAYPLFKQHFYGIQDADPAGIFYPFFMVHRAIQDYKARSSTDGPAKLVPESHLARADENNELLMEETSENDPSNQRLHVIVVWEFLLCSAVSVALFFLLAWHCRLVMRGETSIEHHINENQKKRMRKKGLVFRNPYDFGMVKNLEMLLGISKKTGWSFLKHAVLPSAHPPEGNGLTWETNKYPVDRGLLLL